MLKESDVEKLATAAEEINEKIFNLDLTIGQASLLNIILYSTFLVRLKRFHISAIDSHCDCGINHADHLLAIDDALNSVKELSDKFKINIRTLISSLEGIKKTT